MRVFKFLSRPNCFTLVGDPETRFLLWYAPSPENKISMAATSWSRWGVFRTPRGLDLRRSVLNWTDVATFASMGDWRRVRQTFGRWGNAPAAHNSRTYLKTIFGSYVIIWQAEIAARMAGWFLI